MYLQSGGEHARQLGGEDAGCEQSVVERCEYLQKQRCTVENKCRRMVDQVNSSFCFGSENWSWRKAILDRFEGLEPKGCEAIIQIQKEEEPLTTARAARIIWMKNEAPFLLLLEG